MQGIIRVIDKPLGELLAEAGLISQAQLQIVLREKDIYPDLKIGKILALHSWIKEETADFFAEDIQELLKQENLNLPIGGFFNQAGLLSVRDIDEILHEQKKSGIKFGSTAVLKGLIKEETLNFYLKYFAFEHTQKSNFQYRDEDTLIQKRLTLHDTQTKKLGKSLSEYNTKALVCFKKACSTNNKFKKVKYLQNFIRLYLKIEKLQKKSELSVEKLSINQQNRLDKIYVLSLAKLQGINI